MKDIIPGSGSPWPFGGIFGTPLTTLGARILFAADDGTSGSELWRSDGTKTGTRRVKDINPAGDSSPSNLVNVAGTLFFGATDGSNGQELWSSDGTGPGTQLVKDINLGAAGSSPNALTDVGGTLFFTATEPSHGRELWKAVP